MQPIVEREPFALALRKFLETPCHLIRVSSRLMIVDAGLAKFASIRQIANRILHGYIRAQPWPVRGLRKLDHRSTANADHHKTLAHLGHAKIRRPDDFISDAIAEAPQALDYALQDLSTIDGG